MIDLVCLCIISKYTYLLFLQFNIQLLDLDSKVFGEFLDLALDIELEAPPLAPVLHRDPCLRLLGDEEGWSLHSVKEAYGSATDVSGFPTFTL